MKFKAKTERSDQKKEGEHMVRSIVEALAEYAKVQPDKLFLADGKVELTYLDAWKCVYGYAVHLRELGIRRGDHVVVRNSQNAQLVISQLAIQLVGAVFVPIEKNAADDRIAEIIEAVEAKLYLAAKQGEFSCKWETIKDVLSYKMDDAAEMRISESDDENGDSFRFPEPEETAEVLFTTGTTGKSKGIELTYESVIAVSENVIGSVEMKKDSVELIPVPLSHSHGLRRYYSNILNGGSVVIIDGVIFTKKFFEAIEKYHVTAIDLVPAALAALFKLSGDKLGEYADQLDYVQIQKKDLETGKALSGARFAVYEWNQEQQNYVPYAAWPELVTAINGEAVSGKLYYQKKNEGKFRLQETQPPKNYFGDYVDGEKEKGLKFYDFRVTAQNAGQSLELTNNGKQTGFVNTPQMASIAVKKIGEVLTEARDSADGVIFLYEKQPLAGAKYEITAAEDIYKADGVTLALKKGAVAQQLVTGKDGTAVSRKLYLGRYHVTETEAPQGYVRKDTAAGNIGTACRLRLS